MANAYNSTSTLVNLVQTAYDRLVEWQLRSVPQFRAVVDKRPAMQAMPGSVVVFTIQNDLTALATTPLTEVVDPDAVARPAPTQISVTLQEYGNAELDTLRLRRLAFTDIEQEQAITIGRNMADTMDRLVRTVMDAGSQILSQDNSVASGIHVGAISGTAEPATMQLFQTAVSKLRGAAVDPRVGDSYVAYIHPDVSFDLRTQSGANNAGWITPHAYTDTSGIYAGEVGMFGGARFIETPRCNMVAGSPNIYSSYVVGRQAIAEAVAEEPHVIIGPVVDKLRRFYPLGWYSLIGWSLYRTQALWVCQSASGIAT